MKMSREKSREKARARLERGMTIAQLIIYIGCSQRTAYRIIEDLSLSHEVIRTGRGKNIVYRIV